MKVTKVGDVVGYSLLEQDFNNREPGAIRPAIIVRTWGELPTSRVQLQVFMDGDTNASNDFDYNRKVENSVPPKATIWKTSIEQSEQPEAGKFHYFE